MLLAFDAVDSVHVDAPVVEDHTAPVEDDHTSTVTDHNSSSDMHFTPVAYPAWLYVHQNGTVASSSHPCTPSSCEINGVAILAGIGLVVIIFAIIAMIVRAFSNL